MDFAITALTQGVAILFDPLVIGLLLVGCLWGSLCGALPGLASGLAIGVMIPFTFGMDPIVAVVFIIGINVAVSYANSIPAVLLGLPGTPSAFLTALDGYALHKQGKSSLALAASWSGAAFGQFFSIFFFVALVIPLSTLTYTFLSPELFALYFLGLTALSALTSENMAKGLAAAAFGIAIALVGSDPVSAVPRLTFGVTELRGGFDIIAVVLGLVTISELFKSMRQSFGWEVVVHHLRLEVPGFQGVEGHVAVQRRGQRHRHGRRRGTRAQRLGRRRDGLPAGPARPRRPRSCSGRAASRVWSRTSPRRTGRRRGRWCRRSGSGSPAATP